MLQHEAASAGLFTPQVTYFRTGLKKYELQALRAREFGRPRMSAASHCKLARAALCINANFFDENGEPLGLIIHRGIQLSPLHRGGSTLTSVLSISRNGVHVVHRSSFTPRSAIEAIQAGPRLLKDGKKISGLNESSRSRRSGVCTDERGNLLIFITSSNFGGLSFAELQEELLQPQIGCRDSINLDGGGSSQLFLSAELIEPQKGLSELSISGRDEVPVVLALIPRNQ